MSDSPSAAEPNSLAPASGGAGARYRVRAGDTWSSIALKRYGDAMLGGVLAQVNGDVPGSRPRNGTAINTPDPAELNRMINEVERQPNLFATNAPLHILPADKGIDEAAGSVARDARAHLIRARAGMGLRARGGGWMTAQDQQVAEAKGKAVGVLKQKRPRARPAPELADCWLRRLARLSPRGAIKVARDALVGIGPALSLLGGLREADDGDERMQLVERFIQAYGDDGYKTVNQLLVAIAS